MDINIMRWKQKAFIQRMCGRLPLGDCLYKVIQKNFGRLQAVPMKRLPTQVEMARWLIQSGKLIKGCTFFEVGTGHIPLVPIGFFLSGAGQIITVDLHRRIDWNLTRASLAWIAAHHKQLKALFGDIVSCDVFNERFTTIVKYQS